MQTLIQEFVHNQLHKAAALQGALTHRLFRDTVFLPTQPINCAWRRSATAPCEVVDTQSHSFWPNT